MAPAISAARTRGNAAALGLLCVALAWLPGFPCLAHAATDSTLVFRVRVQDAIGPASRNYIARALDVAESREAACLVLELDTPGGLDESMRDIVKRILGADVPVVVYVAPSGSRAASAGFFILQAAHVAAMAPGTNTGAAHPVQMGGGEIDKTLAGKIENDAASFVRALAQRRGRNVDWAESAVRESASIAATEALDKHVIDVVAKSFDDLLVQLDGRSVEIGAATCSLHTAGAHVESLTMSWRDRVLSTIANPNVAYLLLMLGTMGLAMELWNPGAIFPGVVGAISLLLAFFALQVLPVNQAGLLLLLVGVILLLLEIKVTSYGALTIGGVAALTFGSILLFDTPGALAHLSWSIIVPVVVCSTLFFLFVVGAGLRAQRRKPVTGPEGLVGEQGTADTPLAPEGRVAVHGEYWGARAMAAGEAIEVTAIEAGRRLVVRRVG
jgi:membrane-bound serine protease (ClpP class)